jgi:hypothetical protein
MRSESSHREKSRWRIRSREEYGTVHTHAGSETFYVLTGELGQKLCIVWRPFPRRRAIYLARRPNESA